MLTAAEAAKRENHIVFIGDSRVRELFHEFVDAMIGTPRTYVRTHTDQLVTVDRLRLRAVSTSMNFKCFHIVRTFDDKAYRHTVFYVTFQVKWMVTVYAYRDSVAEISYRANIVLLLVDSFSGQLKI